jgi:hypothetical protein
VISRFDILWRCEDKLYKIKKFIVKVIEKYLIFYQSPLQSQQDCDLVFIVLYASMITIVNAPTNKASGIDRTIE